MVNGSLSEVMRLFSSCPAINRGLRYPLILLWCLAFTQIGQSTADIDASKSSVDKRLDGMEAAAEAALAGRTAGATKYKELVAQVNELMMDIKHQERLEKELIKRTLAVDDLVRKANTVQLKYLALQLNATIEKELQERVSIEQESHYAEVDVSHTVTLEELEQETQPTRMMQESEAQLEGWVKDVIADEVAKYHAEAAEMCSSGRCVSPVEAAQLVQASLTTFAYDGIRMVDHAQGGSIVYELTSNTFDPSVDDPNRKLGNVWWRKYIPQDWERVLPSQWEEWKAGIPSVVMHSFVSRIWFANMQYLVWVWSLLTSACFSCFQRDLAPKLCLQKPF